MLGAIGPSEEALSVENNAFFILHEPAVVFSSIDHGEVAQDRAPVLKISTDYCAADRAFKHTAAMRFSIGEFTRIDISIFTNQLTLTMASVVFKTARIAFSTLTCFCAHARPLSISEITGVDVAVDRRQRTLA